MWGEFCNTYTLDEDKAKSEHEVTTQEIYNNTSSYLNKAVQELKKINCKCTDDDYCDRCCLLDDVQGLLFDVNKKIL